MGEKSFGSGNVYRDLGFADADERLAKADARIREDILREAAALMPEGERADIVSLLDAGEWGEAAHQMKGGPGDRACPPAALALIERAMA